MKKVLSVLGAFALIGAVILIAGCDLFGGVIPEEYRGTFEWGYNSEGATVIAVVDGNSVTFSGDTAGIKSGTLDFLNKSFHITSAKTETIKGIGGASDKSKFILRDKDGAFAEYDDHDTFFVWGIYASFHRQ